MTAINGLPAHVLLVHLIVILAPLTAVLEIVCALWPAARRGSLVWLSLILALGTAVLTPITANAGEWLYDLRRNPSPGLREHAARGDTMIYFAIALFLAAVALVVLQRIERRSTTRHRVTNVVVAVIVIAVGVATIVQTYRIGDTGAKSVWGNEIAHLKQTNAKEPN
jgi:uncharacterized membrane protein